MAGTLWLLRHGDAEPHGARSDFDRRLTERGERQSRAAGRAFVRLGAGIDGAFASPRLRALETARLACAEIGLEPVVYAPLSDGFDERDCARLLTGQRAGSTLLLVGHEPDLSGLVAAITGARVEMKKGGIAAIRDRQLVELLRPSEIELVAGL